MSDFFFRKFYPLQIMKYHIAYAFLPFSGSVLLLPVLTHKQQQQDGDEHIEIDVRVSRNTGGDF